jgi:tetratricopeptide (TPR) repeat protein
VSDHPTRSELDALLRGDLPEERLPAVLRHLLGGCRPCRSSVFPRAAPLLAPQPPPVSESTEAAYDRAIDKAIALARRVAREKELYREALRVIDDEGPFGILGGDEDLQGVEGLRALLDRSWAQRGESPRNMVALARGAAELAERLEPDRLGAAAVADHRCRAWTELANAQRAANDYERAAESLGEASRHLIRGTRNEDLEVRLLDVQASLEGHLCHFAEAYDILDVVAAIHERRGDRHMTGRALVSKGMFKGYHGESAEALELTRRGRELLNERRDPSLYSQAVHNEVHLLVDLERFAEARTLLWSNLGRFENNGGRIDHLKLRGLWGLINAGLGKLDEAARDFAAEREGLQEANLAYTAAIAGLDLAAVFLEKRSVAEAEAVALESLAVFQEMDVPDQGRIALLLLQKALDLRLAVDLLGLLRRTAKFFRRIEHDSTAVFDPRG